jgi:hypothetical protein
MRFFIFGQNTMRAPCDVDILATDFTENKKLEKIYRLALLCFLAQNWVNYANHTKI